MVFVIEMKQYALEYGSSYTSHILRHGRHIIFYKIGAIGKTVRQKIWISEKENLDMEDEHILFVILIHIA